MQILPEPMQFEWNQGNLNKNVKKHNVTNQEAEEVYINTPIILFADAKHSSLESRFGLLGKTNNGRLLSIVFTKRGTKVRIITARPMSRKERRAYEKIKTDTAL